MEVDPEIEEQIEEIEESKDEKLPLIGTEIVQPAVTTTTPNEDGLPADFYLQVSF